MKNLIKLTSILILGAVITFSLLSIVPIGQKDLALAAASSGTQLDFGHGSLPNQSKASDANGLISIIINVMLGAVTTVAVIFIIIGGYQYIGSGANEDMKTKAKKTLTWAISGLVVIILAAVLVNTIIGTIGIIK